MKPQRVWIFIHTTGDTENLLSLINPELWYAALYTTRTYLENPTVKLMSWKWSLKQLILLEWAILLINWFKNKMKLLKDSLEKMILCSMELSDLLIDPFYQGRTETWLQFKIKLLPWYLNLQNWLGAHIFVKANFPTWFFKSQNIDVPYLMSLKCFIY